MEFIYTLNRELGQYMYWIIYGSGVAAIELYMTIIEAGGHVDFFCDMDEFCVGKRLLNKRVLSMQEAAEFGTEACIIVCDEYGTELVEKMKEYKIRNVFIPNF